jgi:ABC-2 type transport system ATP-binding protein
VALMLNGKMVALASPRELRETGLAGTLLEVEAEPAIDALELLPKMPGVKEVTLYGAVLHVLVDGVAPETLEARLREAGLVVRDARPIRPSLEDVFVSRIKTLSS